MPTRLILLVSGMLMLAAALPATAGSRPAAVAGAGAGTYASVHLVLGTCTVPTPIVFEYDAPLDEIFVWAPGANACRPIPVGQAGFLFTEQCSGDPAGAFSCTGPGRSMSMTAGGALTVSYLFSNNLAGLFPGGYTLTGTIVRVSG